MYGADPIVILIAIVCVPLMLAILEWTAKKRKGRDATRPKP
jgi:hypothetical protein